MKKTLIGGSIIALLLSSCSPKTVEADKRGYAIKKDTVHVHDDGLYATRLAVSSVKTEVLSKEVVTGGTIQAIPTQFALIASPFPGRVVKSHIEMGQHVKKKHSPIRHHFFRLYSCTERIFPSSITKATSRKGFET